MPFGLLNALLDF
jgi:hypothetical protein